MREDVKRLCDELKLRLNKEEQVLFDAYLGMLDDASLGVEKIVTNIELQTIKEFAGFPVPRQ